MESHDMEEKEDNGGLDRLRDFLRDLIGNGKRFNNAREMSAALNLEPSRATILYKFLKGAEPRAGVVLDWFERLGISVVYPDGACARNGVEYIPVFNGRAGAGEYFPTFGDGECESIRAVDRSLFHRMQLNPRQCWMLDVVGDSMEPLFSDGSALLVDASDNARCYPIDSKIYVVRYIDAIMVKRLRLRLGEVVLLSENPLRRPIPIPSEDMDRFSILGRVRGYSASA